MALGRLSPFRDIAPAPSSRANAPEATIDSVSFEGPTGSPGIHAGGSGHNASGITGLDPGMVGAMVSFLGSMAGPMGVGVGPLAGGLVGPALGGLPAAVVSGLADKLAGDTLSNFGNITGMGNSMTNAQGEPVVYSGPQSSSFFGLGPNTPSLLGAFSNAFSNTFAGGKNPSNFTGLGTPEAGIPGRPQADVAPNMGNTAPFTALGLSGQGLTSSDMGFVAANPSGSGTVGAPPGGYVDANGNLSNANLSFDIPDSVNFFGARPNAPDPDDAALPDGPIAGTPSSSGIGSGEGQTSGVTGVGPVGTASDADDGGTGVPGISGDGSGASGSGGVGAGDGSGPGGGSDGAPGGQGAHQGGFIDLENSPDSAVDYQPDGQEDARAKEGPMNVEDGEFIVNKEAAGRFGPLLNQLNELGRNEQLKGVLDMIIRGAANVGFGALR